MRVKATIGGIAVVMLAAFPLTAQWNPPPGSAPTAPTTSAWPPASSNAPPGSPPTPGTAPTGPPTPYGRPVTAGGLHAPPPLDPNDPAQGNAGNTAQHLDESEQDDSERGNTWFWFDIEGGFQHVGLETFNAEEKSLTTGFESNKGSGGFIGTGLGARLVYVTIGPRLRVGFFPEWHMFSIGGEVGLRFPLGRLEPFGFLGAGYTMLGNLSGDLHSVPDSIAIRGFNLRAGAGLDFFPIKWLSVGGGFSWELLGLYRPGVDATTLAKIEALATTPTAKARAQELAEDGSGYGTGVTIAARVGLHF